MNTGSASRTSNTTPPAPHPKPPTSPAASSPAPSDRFTKSGPSHFANGMAESSVAAMSNDQLLQLADTPAGTATLKGMANVMRQGPISAERQKQLDRIDAATFTPAAGLKLNGSAADKDAYVKSVRRTMLDSPSFAKTMKDINADAKHPVTINLERNTGTQLDSFRNQTLDLSDLEKLPTKPTPGRPEETTQGAVLAHMMREQREKALQPEPKTIEPAHRAAIESENAYRKDIGQKSMRKLPPDDESRVVTDFGSLITVHYDDGHHEALVFDQNGNLNGSGSYNDLLPR